MTPYILVINILWPLYFSYQKLWPQYIWDPPLPKKMIAPLAWALELQSMQVPCTTIVRKPGSDEGPEQSLCLWPLWDAPYRLPSGWSAIYPVSAWRRSWRRPLLLPYHYQEIIRTISPFIRLFAANDQLLAQTYEHFRLGYSLKGVLHP